MGWRLLQVSVAAALVALAVWALAGPEPTSEPRPVAEVVVTPEQACREWAKATLAMGLRLDDSTRRHFQAHIDYKAGRISEAEKYRIWDATIGPGMMHSGHFRELAAAWKRACLSQET